MTPILIPRKFILGYAHELVEHKSNLVDLGMSHVRSRLITMCCMGCNLSFSLKGLFFESSSRGNEILCEEYLNQGRTGNRVVADCNPPFWKIILHDATVWWT